MISIDFSIYHSPTAAYGNVSGQLPTINELPEIGDRVEIMSKEDIENLGIESEIEFIVDSVDRENAETYVVSFDGIVLNSVVDAEKLMKCLEERYGLWAYRYPHASGQ